MDASTFYALFSTTCFALVGLWWNVVQSHTDWMRDPALRRVVGGVCLSFLLPAVMGLFAQVGGTEEPRVRRTAFITWQQAAVAVLYGLIAVVGAFPELARHVGLRPIRTEALLLNLLVLLAHALVWRYMAGGGRAGEET